MRYDLNNRRYSYTQRPGLIPTPSVPTPEVEKPVTPAPAAPAPWVERGNMEEYFRTRGGHELWDIFDKINKQNPLAARAFWNAAVGMGRGQNDLMAATIHKSFGGDMNAYNDWRNLLHHAGRESYAGNFDLRTGRWTNELGAGNEWDGIANEWDWNSLGLGAWDQGKNMSTGLQSLPGIDPNTGKPYYLSGSDSWATYGAGQYFDPEQGMRYAPPELQARFAAGQVPGYDRQGQQIAYMQNRGNQQVAPNIPVPKVTPTDVKTPVTPPVTTVNTAGGGATTVNPYGNSAGGSYRFNQR